MSVFQSIEQRWLVDKYRQNLLANEDVHKAAKGYLSAPLVDKNTPISAVEFVALDFETTGLDAKKDRIVSLGYTLIKNLRISVADSMHMLVKPKINLSQSNVAVHHLTDDELSTGVTISQMMAHLFDLIKGRVMVVHFDKIERSFIHIACAQNFGFDRLPMRMLDTLKIEIKKQATAGKPISSEQMRLFNLRDAYNLPRYKAHNALQDAMATAELFLAQLAYAGPPEQMKLADFL